MVRKPNKENFFSLYQILLRQSDIKRLISNIDQSNIIWKQVGKAAAVATVVATAAQSQITDSMRHWKAAQSSLLPFQRQYKILYTKPNWS